MRHLAIHRLPTHRILKWAGTQVKSPRPVSSTRKPWCAPLRSLAWLLEDATLETGLGRWTMSHWKKRKACGGHMVLTAKLQTSEWNHEAKLFANRSWQAARTMNTLNVGLGRVRSLVRWHLTPISWQLLLQQEVATLHSFWALSQLAWLSVAVVARGAVVTQWLWASCRLWVQVLEVNIFNKPLS